MAQTCRGAEPKRIEHCGVAPRHWMRRLVDQLISNTASRFFLWSVRRQANVLIVGCHAPSGSDQYSLAPAEPLRALQSAPTTFSGLGKTLPGRLIMAAADSTSGTAIASCENFGCRTGDPDRWGTADSEPATSLLGHIQCVDRRISANRVFPHILLSRPAKMRSM